MSHLSRMKTPGLTISARSQRLRPNLAGRFWNLNAKMQDSKVQHATGALVVMRSLEQGPNPQVSVNQAIPNFPGTPDQISLMNGNFPPSIASFFSILSKLIILRSAPMSQCPHIPRHTYSSGSSSWSKTALVELSRSSLPPSYYCLSTQIVFTYFVLVVS